MADTIYNFPPTAWQVQDWLITPLGVVGIVLLLGVIVAIAKGPLVSGWACEFWPWMAMSCVLVCLVQSFEARASYNHHYLEQVVFGLLVVACVVGEISTLRGRSRLKEKPPVSFVMSAIAVLLLLIWSSFPAGCHPEASRRTQCKNNLKHFGLAMHNYHDMYATFPESVTAGTETSWRVTLLPFVDQADVYARYDQQAAWDSSENARLAAELVRPLDCPTRPFDQRRNQQDQFLTSYVVPSGNGSLFDQTAPSTIRSVTDGTSNTLMIVEACGTDIVWSEPRDMDVASSPISVNAGTEKLYRSDSLLSSYHIGGAQALLADGSVRFVSQNIDPQVLHALVTKTGGEKLPEDSW